MFFSLDNPEKLKRISEEPISYTAASTQYKSNYDERRIKKSCFILQMCFQGAYIIFSAPTYNIIMFDLQYSIITSY